MKKIIKVLFTLLLISGLVAGLIYYGFYFGVSNLTIVNQKISSNKIDKYMSDLKIAFISDIHYNNFMDYERFEKMIQEINRQQPDIVIFGGDLFDNPSQNKITDEIRSEFIGLLKSIKAEYGKFAVLGEEDKNPDLREVEQLLFDADFELLNNESILITKDGSKPINLIGIDTMILGVPDIESAFENVDTNNYTIVVTHTPDLFEQLPLSNVDLVLSGHSHGGQFSLPIIGAINKVEGAKEYSLGTYYVNKTILIVSNGLGTRQYDFRLFSEPECHMIRLKR